MLEKTRNGTRSAEDLELAVEFWEAVVSNMPDWQCVQSRKAHSSDLRRDYVHSHGIALQAIGLAGAQLIAKFPDDWKTRLIGLQKVDWSRANTELWEGRALVGGKIHKSALTVGLVANVVCEALGLYADCRR